MRRMRAARAAGIALFCVACTAEARPSEEARGDEAVATCRTVQPSRPLPAPLRESSGVAASHRQAGVLWTHNDSGDGAELFAVDAAGRELGTTRITGARNEDWEDVAVGPCEGGDCVYIADTGDNERKRSDASIYRVREPRPGEASAPAERLRVSYPDGSHDTEALFVLPTGDIYLVSKGRHDRQTLYRYRAGGSGTLEKVVELGPQPEEQLRFITGASASPSGRWVAIRRYKLLSIYHTADLLAGRTAPALEVDLTPVGEAQGEGVALLDNGRVILSSEGGFPEAPGTIAVLQCELPEE
jgi:hypothetical protein